MKSEISWKASYINGFKNCQNFLLGRCSIENEILKRLLGRYHRNLLGRYSKKVRFHEMKRVIG